MDNSSEGTERRQFFRIDDNVSLTYRALSEVEAESGSSVLNSKSSSRFGLISHLQTINKKAEEDIRSIRQKSPDLADYLTDLEQKIHLLAQIITVVDDEVEDKPTKKVSISAGGIAFRAEDKVEVGGYLEIKLMVYPSCVGIVTLGKVTRCLKNESLDKKFPYTIGIEFSHIKESDREILMQHILKQQAEKLKKLKGERSPQP